MIYKFVKHDISPLGKYKGITEYKLHEKLANGEEPTREEKNRNLVFTSSGWVYKYMGWAYDFREFLTEFWIETEHYGIMRVYAWDKTAIRKNETTKCLKISRIVEVES
jgi:hypothetical protein